VTSKGCYQGRVLMLKAKSGEKRRSPKIGFSPISLIRGAVGEQLLHSKSTPQGASTDKVREKSVFFNFFNLPPNFYPNFDPQYLWKGGRFLHALFDGS